MADLMNHIVSIPLDSELASFIGKKGSEDGLTFFDRKVGNDIIVLLYPTNAKEKPYSIAESMLVSEQILLSTKNVDKEFGEALVAASLLEKRVILTDDNDVNGLLANGILKDFSVTPRDKLLDKILEQGARAGTEMVRIDIDKAFPVHGVGTVVLGVVISGMVKVHDTLYHSSGKQGSVRSIQSQDVDVQAAGPGTRVGLAMKGIEHEDMGKGSTLSSVRISPAKRISVKVKTSPIAKEEVKDGATYLVVSNFSHSMAKVLRSGETTELELEKPIPVLSGDGIFLVRNQTPRLFASGSIVSASA